MLRLYCVCGSALSLSVSSLETRGGNAVVKHWRVDHDGEGHGLATPRQAAAARRKSAAENAAVQS